MRRKGVECLIVPPVYKKACARETYSVNYIKEWAGLLRHNGIPYAVSPNRYIFDDSLFYDTLYNLNKRGVDKRTAYLINDIFTVTGMSCSQ